MAREKGTKNLTMEQRGRILRLYGQGKYTLEKIGEMVGVGHSCVSQTISKYKPELCNLDEKHIEAAEEALAKSLEGFDAFAETTELAKAYVEQAKKNVEDPKNTRVYGNMAKDYIKLLTELRGEYKQRHEVDVTTWSGENVESLLEKVLELEEEDE